MRRQQHDLVSLARFMRDLNDRQSRLFFLIVTVLVRYEAPEFQPLIDEDVSDAAAALASTFETASRGVIYEHRPTSLPAERLLGALKPVLAKAGGSGGAAFDRDAALVLRRIEEAGESGVELPGLRRDENAGVCVQMGHVSGDMPIIHSTHCWVDRREPLVGLLMIQEPVGALSRDLENAVMQAIVE